MNLEKANKEIYSKYNNRLKELKKKYTNIFSFGDGVLKILRKNIDKPVDDELFEYIYNNYITNKLKISEVTAGFLDIDIKMLPKFDITQIFRATIYNIHFIKYKDINYTSIHRLQYNHVIPTNSGVLIIDGAGYGLGGCEAFPPKRVSLDIIVRLNINKNIAKKILLRTGVVDVENTPEEIIKKACLELEYPFFLICGTKTKRIISEETLDDIIDNDLFFSDKSAPTMSGTARTIGYTNRYQTLMYQTNISEKSFVKLVMEPDRDLDELKAHIKKRYKFFSEKFKSSSDEIKLILELISTNIM